MINSISELNDFYDSLDYEFSEDFEIEESEIEESENEESEVSEDSENEDSEVSETVQNDVSGNTSNETSESSGESNFQPNVDIGNDYLDYVQTETLDSTSYDYSSHFEDIKTSIIFLTALLIGLLCGLAFIKGFSKNNEC